MRFHCPRTDGKKRAEIREPKLQPRLVWRRNDFPYHFEEGIDHWVLWSSSGPLLDEALRGEAAERFGTDHEFLIWVNPPELQSVRAMWHAHVLIRKKG